MVVLLTQIIMKKEISFFIKDLTYILIHPDENISVNKFSNPTHEDSNYKTLLLKFENF
tara:strand:- start:710 stop:883 length:174 start_codon:yes stop_codon:yes gene_type:complete